ncbi:hypothetical protein WICPIJ_008077 [Wickerhamomyces pijperi]|uniref:Uncharacterized protein n=1 Tax=Wickerhamomyces pijperi TaxID=599730 RepID=A0A9P8Q138_WICPI|nr:hypothetical protein WICPIJ_008077 [Wickerhamomyces pijperi]
MTSKSERPLSVLKSLELKETIKFFASPPLALVYINLETWFIKTESLRSKLSPNRHFFSIINVSDSKLDCNSNSVLESGAETSNVLSICPLYFMKMILLF